MAIASQDSDSARVIVSHRFSGLAVSRLILATYLPTWSTGSVSLAGIIPDVVGGTDA